MKTVYFVRHGESVGNIEKVFKHPDADMTSLGHEQAKLLAARCADLGIEALISSPLNRATQTADYIGEICSLPVEKNDCFSGTKYASKMIGKPKDGIEAQEYFSILKDLYKDPDATYEDAENFTDMKNRYARGLNHLAERSEDVLLVVTHEAPLKSLLVHALLEGNQTIDHHIDTKKTIWKLDHSSISAMNYDGKRWSLLTWNDRAHFETK